MAAASFHSNEIIMPDKMKESVAKLQRLENSIENRLARMAKIAEKLHEKGVEVKRRPWRNT